jgi:hypothetical protein
MKYMLTIHTDPSGYANAKPEDLEAELKGYEALGKELHASGAFVAGEGLQLDTATTVSVPNGERLVTDGPFAETKEQLGGFYLLDCKDLDEAISWAAKIPGARHGKIEVRPVMDYEAS